MEVSYYGKEPYTVVVLHGGPGIASTIKEVANELGKKYGVIEPFQSHTTMEENALELHDQIQKYCKVPVTIVGHCVGALLGAIFASEYPQYVKKLICIGCPPLEDSYTGFIDLNRKKQLSEDEFKEYTELHGMIRNNTASIKQLFERYCELIRKSDIVQSGKVQYSLDDENWDLELFAKLIQDEEALCKQYGYFEIFSKIFRTITFIHGNRDPHPVKGIKVPLTRIQRPYTFFELEKCGHYPWLEISSKNDFYQIIEDEIANG